MRSNSNTNPDPAKWLQRESGTVPPPAFILPDPTKSEFLTLSIFARDHADESGVHGYIERVFTCRYGGMRERFEYQIETAKRQIELLQHEDACLEADQNRLKPGIIQLSTMLLPKGKLAWIICCLALTVVAFHVVEWLNLAGFAARSEFQNLWSAMLFTVGCALAPLALKLLAGHPNPRHRLPLIVLVIIACVLFVGVFTGSYVPELGATDQELLTGIPSAPAEIGFWGKLFTPALRLPWQMLLFGTVSYTFASYIARFISISTVTCLEPSPAYESVKERRAEVLKQLELAGEQLTNASGNKLEWEASLAVAQCQWLAIWRGLSAAADCEDEVESRLRSRATNFRHLIANNNSPGNQHNSNGTRNYHET